jgi:hypothetical protein
MTMIISREYNLYLYPIQSYDSEKVNTIIQSFSNIDDIKINEEEYKKLYWLYEIQLITTEEVIIKRKKVITKTSSIYNRTRLNSI